jgi:transposase-like protein
MTKETEPEPQPAPPTVNSVFKRPAPPKRRGGRPAAKGSRLELLKEKAIAALLTTDSISAAARKVDVSPNTLRKWMEDTDFARAYAEAGHAVLQGIIRKLQNGATTGIDVLEEIAENIDEEAHNRVVAAAKLVEFGIKAAIPAPAESPAAVEREVTLLSLVERAQAWKERHGRNVGTPPSPEPVKPEVVGPVPPPPALPWKGETNGANGA